LIKIDLGTQETSRERTGKVMLNRKGEPKHVGLSNLNVVAYAAAHIYNDM